MSITYIPPRVPSVEGFLKEDGTVPLTGVWDTGNVLIKGPSAIYTSSTAPSAPYTKMLWNDTSIASRQMIKRWNGSAWQVVYGYETASRTVSLVHDHGALLDTNTIRDSAWNSIGAFGALYVTITIEIENKTLKNFINAAAVDAGSGKVKLPLASGHGFVAGERVCVDGTTNYNGVYVIDSVEEGYIVIPATYVAETILASAIVRVVILAYGNTFGTNYNQITLKAKNFSSERSQNKSVVFFSAGSYSCIYIKNWALKGLVQGIKFVSPGGSNGVGLYIQDSSKVDVEYCAFYNCYNGVICTTYSSVTAVMNTFHSCSFASISSNVSSTVISRENKSFSDGQYGLFADWGGTIKKIGAQQPTGTVANEFAATANAGQMVPSVEGFLKEDGTVPLTGVWDTGNYNILSPSAIYTSATAPTSPYVGMLWNDTSIASRKMIRSWNGSAWQVVYGYETASRTISLVHDHGALLTSSLIRDAINEIGTFSAPYVVASVEIENKTLKNFINAVAVDAGSGKVKLPLASGHGFLAGEIVCIDGTTNYDGIYTIDSVESGYIVVPATYASETIPSSAIVRVVISSTGTSFPPKYIKINMFAKGFSQTRDQMKSVVLYAPGNTPCCYFVNWAMPSKVQGIKFVSPNGSSGSGFFIQDSSKIDVEYCAFSRCLYYAACVNTHSSVNITQSHFKSCSAGAIAVFNSATILSSDNESVLPGSYGLYANLGGTIKKTSAQQPTGTVANEYANTSKAGQIIPTMVPSVEGFLKEDGTVPLTGVWDTGNYNIKGPSAIYTSSTAPSAPYTNMLWNDTSISTRIMIRRWSGSEWQVVYGYETASRTVSLVHDHGALLTASDLSSTWNDIGKNGAVLITIEIDNKTYKTFEAGAAVDAGGGLVKLPIASGHGFVAGERVCIDGTVNYDGVFVINSVEETFIIIHATYVAETIPADAVIRVVIENGINFGFNTNSITVEAKGYSSGTRTQKQRVVIYNTLPSAHPYFGSLLRETHVNGIKVHVVNGIGFQEDSCNSIFFESCAVSGNMQKAAISLSQGGSGVVRYLSIKNVFQGIIASYGTSVVSFECKSIANVSYGLYAFWGGTIIKASTQQPTGSTANEFASYGGLIR